MTDLQLLTIGLSIVIPLSMLIYSNSRITDVKETLRAEIKVQNAEMAAGFTRISQDIQSLRDELKMHVLEHHR